MRTVPAGIGAYFMSISNLMIWAFLTAFLGSMLAVVGLCFIYLALVLANRRAQRVFSDPRIRAPNEVLTSH